MSGTVDSLQGLAHAKATLKLIRAQCLSSMQPADLITFIIFKIFPDKRFD